MLKKDTIRSVEKYVDSSTGAIEDLEKDTKLTLGELNEYGRYQIVQVDGQKRTGICTVDKGSVIPIEDVLSLKTININTSTDTIIIPPTPIKIKAGEVIGLVGEYNRSKQINRELLHLEVFTKDDVISFSDTAKSTYMSDTSEDKPKPKTIKIPKDKDIYEIKEQSVIDSSDGTATIKDSTGTKLTTAPLSNGTKVEIDTSIVVLSNRYKLLKIKTDDISSNNWNIYKGSIGKIKVAENTNTKQSADKIVLMKDVKTITLDNKKYIYINEDKTQALLYTDCEEIHPITFEWARIIDESSDDDISIFSNLHKYLLPEVEDYKEEVLKVSSMYEKLFKEIDTNSNGQIEAQELEDATKKEGIKKITSKFIVKHSSEWDAKINVPQKIKEILEEHKDNIKNYVKIKDHLENEEKRINNLNFFDECSSIDGFPDSDKVFHINPIGLVGEFGGCQEIISKELMTKAFKNATASRINEYHPVINKALCVYKLDDMKSIAYFLGQASAETADLQYKEEIASGSAYEGRSDLGNVQVGDGKRFKGRGMIQLTGRTNYESFQKYARENFSEYNDIMPLNIKTKR
ncbi:hypothetical protein [Halarcobacter anaerophilus]|uniref:hypothetical protein n=1 Tax=Halarcobacter anaerophilus TaxID=877500 RepID=UPI0018E349FC|nr:hypothetical protein [Halarcobacter anaerophilus]